MVKFILSFVMGALMCAAFVNYKLVSSGDFAFLYGLEQDEVIRLMGEPDSEVVTFYATLKGVVDEDTAKSIYEQIHAVELTYGGTKVEFNANNKVYRITGERWLR